MGRLINIVDDTSLRAEESASQKTTIRQGFKLAQPSSYMARDNKIKVSGITLNHLTAFRNVIHYFPIPIMQYVLGVLYIKTRQVIYHWNCIMLQ